MERGDVIVNVVLVFFVSSFVFVSGLVSQNQDSEQEIPLEEPVPEGSYAPGELIVKFKEDPNVRGDGGGGSIPSINSLNNKYKVKKYDDVLKFTKDNKLKKIKLGEGVNVLDAAGEFSNDLSVEYAEPNYLFYVSFVPNDEKYGEQWAHQNTKAELGWDIERGNSDVVIAIIDTGVDYFHEDLVDNVDCDETGCLVGRGYDFVDIDVESYIEDGYELIEDPEGNLLEDYTTPDNEPTDYHGHGTHCAGIAAAKGNNNVGVSGVCPNCKIMPVRAGFGIIKEGDMRGQFQTDDLINSLHYAADNGADIISMSFGSFFPLSNSFEDAIDYSYDKGVILVAAAGNMNLGSLVNPADYENVIGVTATDVNDQKSSFSSYGYRSSIVAPGSDILSTVPIMGGELSDETGYKIASGTSMAAPYVSGLLGLIKSKNIEWTREQNVRALYDGADVFGTDILTIDEYVGIGRVNVHKSLLVDRVSSSTSKIDFPINNENEFYESFDVIGTALGDEYVVEYGEGIYPSEWIEFGSGGTVENGFLAKMDVSNLQSGKLYTIRLKVMDDFGENIDRKDFYYFDIWFSQDFWNINCGKKTGYYCNNQYSTPVYYDLDYDGNEEIISGTPSYVYSIDNNGEELWRYRFFIRFNVPAVGDLDGNGYNEIVLAGRNYIRSIGSNGNYLNEYRDEFNINGGVPTLADIDNDGKIETIILNEEGHVLVLDSNLEIKEGWHDVKIESSSNFRTTYSSAAVGDLDLDGFNDIVIGAGGFPATIYVFEHTGKLKEGDWPKSLDEKRWGAAVPSLADLDNDGDLEIIFGTDKRLYVWHHDGEEYWKVDATVNAPVVGDLDRDGDLEIVGGTHLNYIENEGLYIIDHQGNIVVNRETMDYVFAISLANVDYDSEIEIIGLSEDGNLYIWNYDGTLWEGFPTKIANDDDGYFFSFPSIGDLDKDGDVDIVVGTDNGMYMFDLEAPFDPEGMEWPMFQHDAWHTGQYGFVLPEPIILPEFQRGEVNGDGFVDLSDAVFILSYIFQGGLEPECLKAADTNDDGALDLSDGVYLLNYLFNGGPEPPEPFVEEGRDPTADELSC